MKIEKSLLIKKYIKKHSPYKIGDVIRIPNSQDIIKVTKIALIGKHGNRSLLFTEKDNPKIYEFKIRIN